MDMVELNRTLTKQEQEAVADRYLGREVAKKGRWWNWERRLWCNLDAIEVDPENRTVRLKIHLGGCCDMLGAISLAQEILPTCNRVVTHNDNGLDTCYAEYASGKWGSYCWQENKNNWKSGSSCPEEIRQWLRQVALARSRIKPFAR